MAYTHFKVSAMVCIVLCLVSSVFGYSGGSGTTEDPYQVGTISDWNDLTNNQSDWNANFVMIADINLLGVPLIPVGNDINGTYIYFSGVFDGNNHIIRNAAITGRYNATGIGLFGRIDSNSQIKNLGAEDVNMTGSARVGGLVGCSYGIISNCFVTGMVRQNWETTSTSFGGLAGKNFGTITGCHAACDVNAYRRNVGGLVGWNIGTIIDSYANGTVNGDRNVGGLVGFNSFDSGDYIATYYYIGYYIGTIARCYSTGSVAGSDHVGGLAGDNGDEPMARNMGVSITNCYSISTVSGGAGLVCHNFGHITNCYAAGPVIGSAGGLTSIFPIPASNSFWDIEATGQTTSGSGTGLTTAQMKTLTPFTSAGWDFVETWGVGENQTYPFLRKNSGSDLNYDGYVNFNDFAVWANHWLEGI